MTELEERAAGILLQLERRGSKRNRDGMARYGLTAEKVFGVSVARLHDIARRVGKNHALALLLWESGWYEARMLAALIDEPSRVTVRQMDRWARDFENWGICDTCCMHLFDRTPHAWGRAEAWSRRKAEFVKRAGFALVASLARHDKEAGDEPFLRALAWIEREAHDDRNFVKKAVNWALRAIAERNTRLNRAALAVARRLAARPEAPARWIGTDALRQLRTPASRARLARTTKPRLRAMSERRVKARATPRAASRHR